MRKRIGSLLELCTFAGWMDIGARSQVSREEGLLLLFQHMQPGSLTCLPNTDNRRINVECRVDDSRYHPTRLRTHCFGC